MTSSFSLTSLVTLLPSTDKKAGDNGHKFLHPSKPNSNQHTLSLREPSHRLDGTLSINSFPTYTALISMSNKAIGVVTEVAYICCPNFHTTDHLCQQQITSRGPAKNEYEAGIHFNADYRPCNLAHEALRVGQHAMRLSKVLNRPLANTIYLSDQKNYLDSKD